MGFLTRAAGAIGLTLALAGCIDASVDIEVLSETEARATMTQVMGADFYAMVKMSAEDTPDGEGFCDDGELSESADGSATCVLVEEGEFADLTMGGPEGEDTGVSFTATGPGLVRVAFDTSAVAAEIGAGEELDAETKQMMEAFFAGRAVTMTIGGGEIVDTNMEEVEGKAELVIPFLDLINGTAELPEEIFAVVRVGR